MILSMKETRAIIDNVLLNKVTLNISKPAISRIPMKLVSCLLPLSRVRFILVTSHLNMRSYMALLIASTENSDCS